MLASLAIKTLCETPGLNSAGVVDATIAVAAMTGRKPARIKIGIIEGPTAAQRPAVEGMATAQRLVTNMQAGKSKTPNLRSGRVKRATKCTSHLVKETAAANPMAEQIAMINELFVMDLSNCWKATIGFNEHKAIIRPALIKTNLVSYLLIKA